MTRDEAAGVILQRVIEREGGIADVGDGKGVTRWGQTPAWLQACGFASPATVADALANYRTWLVRTRLIAVCDMPDAFADAVVDWAVHSGHVAAIRALQIALGIRADGMIGPETEAAIEATDRRRMAAKIVGARVRFIGRTVTTSPTQYARFAAGWMNRLAGQIEALV